MKTTSLKCPSCNASLKVEDFNKIIVCPYCDSTVVVESVSAENTSTTEDNRATREGGAAGKNRASVKDSNSNQKENAGAAENTIGSAADDEKNKYNYNAGGYAENKPTKKRRTWLWVLGWMCIFPIPLTILMLSSPKTKSIDLKARIIIVAVSWVVYLIIYSVYAYCAR